MRNDLQEAFESINEIWYTEVRPYLEELEEKSIDKDGNIDEDKSFGLGGSKIQEVYERFETCLKKLNAEINIVVDKEKCEWCGENHRDRKLFRCTTCGIYVCVKQVRINFSKLSQNYGHRNKDNSTCGPCVEIVKRY